MNAPDIRDLLDELAAPLDAPDLARTAWDDAAARRRRRHTAVGAAAVALVVLAAGTAFVRDHGDGGTGPAQPGPTSTPPEGSEGTFEGFTLWRAPGLNDESGLPAAESPLPSEIDLSAPNPSNAAEPLDRAVAAFAIAKGATFRELELDGVMLVSPDGALRHLDAPQLAALPTPGDGPASPFGAGALSPDGTRLVVRQADGVAVYDIPRDTWTSYRLAVDDAWDLPRWSDDGGQVWFGTRSIDPGTGEVTDHSDGSPVEGTTLWIEYWAGVERVNGDRRAIGAAWLDEHLPMGGLEYPAPAVVALGDGLQDLLVIPDPSNRWKDCCAVAGWLDDDTVVYESRFGGAGPGQAGAQQHLVAWNSATGAFGLVSTVSGSRDLMFLGSYADLRD